MRIVSDIERRARLGVRHGFTENPADLADVASRLVGIHSTDPVTVFLSAAARHAVDTIDDVETALYSDRSVLRMLGMRRTLFVEPVGLVGAVQRGYTDTFVAKERTRLAGWLERTGVAGDGGAHIERMVRLILDHLTDRGEASTREITAAIPELQERFTPPVGAQTGTVSVGSRVVLLLTASGLLARTRPLGSWISSQYRYAPMKDWLGTHIGEIEPAAARSTLARAWLSSYGPGTTTDLQWWSGWNLGHTREALSAIGAVEVELEGGTGFVLAEDLDPVEPADPWATLLPSLDSTPMGWKQRDWYLGVHAPRLFDRNGNIGPTVWCDGRVVGGWGQRPDGELAIEFLEPVSDDCRRMVEVEAARLTSFVGPARFTPRFPTPLERALARP